MSPMRCRRCKRTIQDCFLSLSFSQNMDGKRENRQDPRKPEDLLIFLLLSRSMTLAKDIGRSASRCRKRVHHLIHRVQMMLFLWADYKLHINGGNLMKKRTVSVLLTTCLAAGMLDAVPHPLIPQPLLTKQQKRLPTRRRVQMHLRLLKLPMQTATMSRSPLL